MLLLHVVAGVAQSAEFPYPSIPDSLRNPEARAAYMLTHYWDNANLNDSTLLYTSTYGEQGFVNYIDLLGRFGKENGPDYAKLFINKAWATGMARRRFDGLIEYYLDDSSSPVRNDRTYLWLLQAIAGNPNVNSTERSRYRFKAEQAAVNLPGDTARNFSFKGDDGRMHHLSDYRGQRICLFIYDPDCESCHTAWTYLQAHPLPSGIKMVRVHVNDSLLSLYAIRSMPTIYLLDKGNVVLKKECKAEDIASALAQ